MAHNWLIRTAEVGLFGGLLIHIIQGLSLSLSNQTKERKNTEPAPAMPTANGILGAWASWEVYF